MFASKEIKEFCQAMLDTYWEWQKQYYEVVNPKKGQFIWIKNGISFLTLNNHALPYMDKLYLHKKLKELFAIQVKDPERKYNN